MNKASVFTEALFHLKERNINNSWQKGRGGAKAFR